MTRLPFFVSYCIERIWTSIFTAGGSKDTIHSFYGCTVFSDLILDEFG